jgi:Mn-containing catalase
MDKKLKEITDTIKILQQKQTLHDNLFTKCLDKFEKNLMNETAGISQNTHHTDFATSKWGHTPPAVHKLTSMSS